MLGRLARAVSGGPFSLDPWPEADGSHSNGEPTNVDIGLLHVSEAERSDVQQQVLVEEQHQQEVGQQLPVCPLPRQHSLSPSASTDASEAAAHRRAAAAQCEIEESGQICCLLRSDAPLRLVRRACEDFIDFHLRPPPLRFELEKGGRTAVVRASCFSAVILANEESSTNKSDIGDLKTENSYSEAIDSRIGKDDKARRVLIASWSSNSATLNAQISNPGLGERRRAVDLALSNLPLHLASKGLLRYQSPVTPSANAPLSESVIWDGAADTFLDRARGGGAEVVSALVSAAIRATVARWRADDQAPGKTFRRFRAIEPITDDTSEIHKTEQAGSAVIVHFPRNFGALRNNVLEMDASLLASFCEGSTCSLENSGGKSSSWFFRSHDRRFLLKTVLPHELGTLRKLIPEYVCHVRQSLEYVRNERRLRRHFANPSCVDSDTETCPANKGHVCLLVEILGVFEVRTAGAVNRQLTFLLMKNIFEPAWRVRQGPYDLKGSVVGRHTEQAPNNIDNSSRSSPSSGTPLKDLNFVQDMGCLPFSSASDRLAFRSAVETDAEFLRSMGITDYSLLAGTAQVDEAAPVMPPRKTDRCWSAKVRGRALRSSAGRLEVFCSIIDILQSNTLQKRMETGAKVFVVGGGGAVVNSAKRDAARKLISSSDPDFYCARFIEFCKNVVAPGRHSDELGAHQQNGKCGSTDRSVSEHSGEDSNSDAEWQLL